jgi:glycosyltransferase involved in cell wall biosynthesis
LILNRIISTVSNDIYTDNRVHKIVCTLLTNGYQVTIVGRKFKKSKSLSDRPYQTHRFRLTFNSGPLFYVNLNIRLLFYLLFAKVDIVLSNDLDTLPACWLASSLRRKTLVFDSHELFPEVPELLGRPFVKKIWQMLEKSLIKRIDAGITVCSSIAEYYKEKYGITFEVVRNVSKLKKVDKLQLPKNNTETKKIIYQGALNIGRGIELAISSMQYIDNTILVIAGTGDIDEELKALVNKLSLGEKVNFTGRLSYDELGEYTRDADIGISLEEDLGLNYRYALPNKLFDYIQARIPVIVSDLPEMKSVIDSYDIGEILYKRTPEDLAEIMNTMLKDLIPSGKYKVMLETAANELCWEKEELKVISLFKLLK